jgi:hypothetical protein
LNAFGMNKTGSPSAAPPAPPPPPPAPRGSSPGRIPTAGGVALGPDSPSMQGRMNTMPDASTYTLTNGGRGRADSGARSIGSRFVVQDSRFKFQPDDQLPKPRDFHGGPKRYRAGRGSSVPLDLRAFE